MSEMRNKISESADVRKIAVILSALAPSLIALTFFFWPLIESVKESFRSFYGEDVGWQNYIDAINNPAFISAFQYTLGITLIVLAVTIVSSVVLAMALRRTFVGKKVALFMLQVDVAVPSIACATMMILVLSKTGALSTLLYNLGLIKDYTEFPNIFYNSNGLGVIISIVWLFVPYITLSLISVLHSISNEEEDQAATLGIGKVKRFIFITLPSLKSSIAYTSILCFACTFASFELPSLVGDQHSMVTLAYYYYNILGSAPRHMESYSISVMVTIITLAVSSLLMYYSLSTDEKRRG